MSEQDWFSKDFYKVLGVDKTADKKAITKAYRKLARKWHLDAPYRPYVDKIGRASCRERV